MKNKLFCFAVLLLCYGPLALAQCPPSYNFSSTVDTGYQHLEAEAFIESSGLIIGSAKITYDAGDYVLLGDGFHVNTTAQFWAVIDGCNGSVSDAEEVEGLNAATILPNPTTGLLQVVFPEPVDQPLNLVCFDLMGRAMCSRIIPRGAAAAEIDLSALPAGIYLLQIVGEQSPQTKVIRVVKQ